jgi:heavy metal translocating P-type ATPase
VPRVAHSVRGRLRVRYPAPWLRPRCATLESRLKAVPGVRAVRGKPLTGSLSIEYDPFLLAETAILTALRELEGELARRPSALRHRARPVAPQSARASLLTLVGTTSVLAATCCLPVPAVVSSGLVVASCVPAFLRAGLTLAVRRRLNGDVLEAATLGVLIVRRHNAAAALLSWLRSVGEYLVAQTITTTRRSLIEVVAPPDVTVLVRRNGQRRPLPVTALVAGDAVVVGAGARIPVDGTIVGGEALVNQQSMTGEAMPVERREGDRVFAATTVEHGEIEIIANRVGLDTAVGRIVRTIQAAAGEKSRIQVFAERLADREVVRTLGLASAGAALSRSIEAGTAILVADYGLAARVGIPTAILTSIKRAAGHGILIKGPGAVENLARVDTVVFDKTGTLTTGVPDVTRVITYGGLDEDELVRLAAAAERGLRHPIARAVARLASSRRLEVPPPTAAQASVGLGMDVRVEGRRVLVGSRRFLESNGVDVDHAKNDEAAAHAVGASPTFVAVDGRLAGLLVLQDRLRDDAAGAVRALRARRMRNVIMLSGDHPEPTRVMAESLGLRHHYAEFLPEDKARLVRELKAEGRVVAMVGDGVNDALALAEADVGISVPGGAEVATEAADVVLLEGGLDRVVRALDLARASIAAVRRTMGIAARANLAVVGLASFGLARPVASILLSHGVTVGAAIATAARGGAVAGANVQS